MSEANTRSGLSEATAGSKRTSCLPEGAEMAVTYCAYQIEARQRAVWLMSFAFLSNC
jgi:hypothetical protein